MRPWQEFVSSLISSLAWPIVVLISVLLFKDSLLNLIKRVAEFEWLGARVRMADLKKLDAATESVEVEAAQVATIKSSAESRHTTFFYTSFLLNLKCATEGPIFAVLVAWNGIESALLGSWALLNSRGAGEARKPPSAAMTVPKILAREGRMSERQLKLFLSLYETRNDIVHSARTITQAQAFEYLKSANLAVRLLQDAVEL